MVAFDHPGAVTPRHRFDQANGLGEIGQFVIDEVAGQQHEVGLQRVGRVNHCAQYPAGCQPAYMDIAHVRNGDPVQCPG
jgi:hypothetical protein